MFGLFRVQTSVGTVLGVHKARQELVHCHAHGILPGMPAAFLYVPEHTYGLAFLSFDNPDDLPFAPHGAAPAPVLVVRYVRQVQPAQYAFCHPHTGRFLTFSPALDDDEVGTVAYHTEAVGPWECFNLLGIADGEVTPSLASFTGLADAVAGLEPTPVAWSGLLCQGPAHRRLHAAGLLAQAVTSTKAGSLSAAALLRPDMLDVLQRCCPDDPWAVHALPALRGLAPGPAAHPGPPAGLWRRVMASMRRSAPMQHGSRGAQTRPIGPELDMLASAGADGGFVSLPHQAAVLLRRAVPPGQGCCILATARNEGTYLLDWIAHHRAIGIDRIILYTNGNDDGSDALLSALAAAGEITWWPSVVGPGGSPQGKAYGHALGLARDVLAHRWCAVIDLDEYIGFDAGRFASFPEYLDAQEVRAVDAITLNWLMVSSSGQGGWSPGPVAERFQRRLPGVNSHVKTVFRPERFHHSGPHLPVTDAAHGVVVRTPEGGLHRPGWDGAVATMSEAPCADTAWISHYFFRSAEEYLAKFSRSRGDDPYQAGPVEIPAGFVASFLEQAGADTVPDDRTLRCAPSAAAFKAGLLAIPTVANAARLVERRLTDARAASRPHVARLADTAPDEARRRFYAMVRDGLGP